MRRPSTAALAAVLVPLVLGSLLGLLVGSPGCVSPQKATYLSVEAVTIATDAAMSEWAKLSVEGKTTPAQDASVRRLYGDYQRVALRVEETLVQGRTNRLSRTSATAAANWMDQGSAPLIEYVAGLLTPERAAALRARKGKP